MIAIIPARGGSKEVPGKNIRVLAGKPLILWTIEAAKKAKFIDHIVLSTDDKEIAKICEPTGIDIPFMRPSELAQDQSLAIDNYIYTVDRLKSEFKLNFNEFAVLLPTTPLRNSFDIDKAISVFREKKADSVISVTRLHFPLEWIIRSTDDGTIKLSEKRKTMMMMNRQEHCQYLIPNGGVNILNTKLMKKFRSYYFENTHSYIMPQIRSLDIDNEFDFITAETYLSKNEK